MPSDDTSLLRTFCASRDEDAFTRLVRRYLPMVQAVAQRRLGSAALAEEATQNVFALLARKVSSVARHPERLGAWLHRAAFLEASNLARNEARFSRIPAAAEFSSAITMDRPEIFEQLDAALLALPETDRELLLRRYWKGEDFRTIAAALGRSVESCTKRVERSLTKLGARLGGAIPAIAVGGALTAMKPAASAATATAMRVAEGALQRAGSAGGTASGILSGGLIAASLAAILCGYWMGSPADAEVPRPVRGPAQKSLSPLAAARPLPPRESVPRPGLQDVLASIDAGRLGPLVHFLAEATPAELGTMLEDRLTYDSYFWEPHPDADYEDHPGHLMLRRWTEIDPLGALDWSTDLQLGGRKAAAIVFETWLPSDPHAASAAFASLPAPQQRLITAFLSYGDDRAVEILVSAFPKMRWALDNGAFHRRNEEDPAEAKIVVSRALEGKLDPDSDLEKITKAFVVVAGGDPEGALEQAARLPADPARTSVPAAVMAAVALRRDAALPDSQARPSWERAALSQRRADAMARENPKALAVRIQSMPPGSDRSAAVAALIHRGDSMNVWNRLDVLSSLHGTVSGSGSSVPVRGLPENMGMGVRGHREPGADSLLHAAALQDPHRALTYISRVAGVNVSRGSTGSARSRIQMMLGQILNAWVIKDPPGVSAWFAGFSPVDRRTIRESFFHQFTLNDEAVQFLRTLSE